MRMFRLALSQIVFIFITIFMVCIAAASQFSPHRAFYKMTLEEAHTHSGISNVIGKMAVEWKNSCAGWTFEYHSVIDVETHDSMPIRLSSNATSWESSDGRSYRFSVLHKTNGNEMERIEGVAEVNRMDGAGQIRFNLPKPKTIELPKGTLFPVAHSRFVMGQAKSGELPQFASRRVFDGMDVKGLYQVNAVIGSSSRIRNKAKKALGATNRLPSWSVTLGYFALKSFKSVPDHEIKLRLFANGVADQLIMDFDEFSIRATIGQLDILPQPSCN